MSSKNSRTGQTTRFLKWIQKHGGWWYLICTPNEEHMDLQMVKTLVERLYNEGFYEIIFVLLMVHRDEPVMAHVTEYLLLDGMVERWEQDKEEIVRKLLEYFE